MAEKEGPVHSAVEHMKWFLIGLAVLIFLWFYSGGYQRSLGNNSPLLLPPSEFGFTGQTNTQTGSNTNGTGSSHSFFGGFVPNTINMVPDAGSNVTGKGESSYNNPNTATPAKTTGQIYTINNQTNVAVKNNIETSRYTNAMSIENYSGVGNGRPDEEYVTIKASGNNTKKISLAGWKLKSGVYGNGYDIESQGVYLPYLGTVNVEQPIELAPGERAIIVTGRPPTGVSFKENLCTGYFEQHQDFRPPLSLNCPVIRDEHIPADPHGFNNYCLDVLDQIPQCQVYTQFTTQLTPECQRYIINYDNYTGCVNLHKNEPNFYSSTWRIFLKQDVGIWHNRREIIELVDPSGKIVDTVSF
ncbi:MAG: hypothetical protein RLZZ347_575 [Candidatus Parcubacteria bacterium]|jgi:hypothetical protein